MLSCLVKMQYHGTKNPALGNAVSRMSVHCVHHKDATVDFINFIHNW